MPYLDKTLTCRDCGEPFVFTAGEQEFYAQKGFTNEPTRCPSCRQARKQQSGGRSRDGYRDEYSSDGNRSEYGSSGYGGGSRSEYGERKMYTVPCSEPGCTIDAVVPFQPRGDGPVYCSECFQKQRQNQRTSRW
jgi:CxxC-x17-CxxC domain-containing protein